MKHVRKVVYFLKIYICKYNVIKIAFQAFDVTE